MGRGDADRPVLPFRSRLVQDLFAAMRESVVGTERT
jgi:hypothetical protein